MGTSFNQYFLLGIKRPFPKDHEDAIDEDYEDNGYRKLIVPKNGLNTISDGMNCEYQYIGRILAKSAIGEPLNGHIPFTVPVPEVTELLAALITIQFGIKDPDIQYHFFTHWH